MTPPAPTRLLRARLILPADRPPVENGALFISGDRITAVGSWGELQGQTADHREDLGEVVVLPGLVNAHCHLDYTRMAGCLPPTREFPDWIKAILALKANWSYTDFGDSWLAGAHMLLRHGCTTVVDIEAVPELLPEVWQSVPLRVVSCLELTGIRSGRSAARLLAEAEALCQRVEKAPLGIGYSPHALYSTPIDLLPRAATRARATGRLLTTHVAKSRSEFDLYARAAGSMHAWLQTQRTLDLAGEGSPVALLERLGVLGPGFLAVHVNYLGPGDAERLARHGVSVVHCPRSHAYFRHDPFPWAELRRAGVNICLGTDSLATVRTGRRDGVELDLFAEMRAVARAQPDLDPAAILALATTHPARAWAGFADRGRLAAGTLADLVTVPFSGPADAAPAAILDWSAPVRGCMIGGQWVVTPPEEGPCPPRPWRPGCETP